MKQFMIEVEFVRARVCKNQSKYEKIMQKIKSVWNRRLQKEVRLKHSNLEIGIFDKNI